MNSLCRILSQTSPSSSIQCQISLAASLISRVCREERHQQNLASSGALDALATKLASFVVAEGLVVPGAEILAQKEALQEYIPQAAPPNANLSVILEAIAVVIADSKFRASQLLYSPSILAIFPLSQPTDFVANQNTRAAWNAFNTAGLSARQNQLNAVDFLLPCVPYTQPRNANVQAPAFPPLGTSGSREIVAENGRKLNNTSLQSWVDMTTVDRTGSNEALGELEEPESPLIAFLIYTLRSQREMERLTAASVLTVLYRAGLANKTRETAIGLLVIPLLVHMLDDPIGAPKTRDNFADSEAVALDWAIRERAPSVLAMLITDSEHLQKAALEAGVVGKLSKILKVSYDPVPEASQSHPWSPRGEEGEEQLEAAQYSFDTLGQSPLLVHKIKIRESALKAIAALVPFKDEYRKAIVDQGMVPYIVESMNPNPGKPMPKAGDKSEKTINGSSEDEAKRGYGSNPVSVLIAACGAIRALSRSVSILRTTLIDNGVVMPVFRLLQHPDIEVQIAATASTCNLVTDVSPMRDVILPSSSK